MLLETARAVTIPLLALAAPLGALIGLIKVRERRTKRRGSREPFGGKLLRPPGETLRRELDALNESINESLVGIISGSLLILSMATLLYYQSRPALGLGMWAVYGISALGGYVYSCRQLFRLLDERKCKRLGYRGERAVGEELNLLMLDGWRVFHDVPTPKLGNIDHVVVGRGGVYAVETKTRSKGGKGKAAKVDADHVASFDGQAIRLADGPPWPEPIEQVTNEAKWLRGFLAEAAGEKVAVQPIVVLPGWWVKRLGRGAVRVINPGEIRGALDKGEALDEKQLTRVCHQLDRLCRDVEF